MKYCLSISIKMLWLGCSIGFMAAATILLEMEKSYALIYALLICFYFGIFAFSFYKLYGIEEKIDELIEIQKSKEEMK